MKNLIGQRCRCVFNLPHNEWPFPGYPAWVTVLDVDMPMVQMKTDYGAPKWVNSATILTIETTDRDSWRGLGEEEVDAIFDAMPDGANGFLKTWGYRQFARAIGSKLRDLNHKNEP